MTARPAPTPPAAVAAYLRGVERRARLLARVQAGGLEPGDHALAAVSRVFAAEAGRWPIAQWPREYWRLLLASPPLRRDEPAAEPGPLPGVARLPAGRRAAVLLQLLSALDEEEIAAVLGTTVADYQHRIRSSLPADALGGPDIDVWRAWQAAAQRALAEVETLPAAVAAPPPAKRSVSDPGEGQASARWLWLGVAACVLAFAAAFALWPAGRETVRGWLAPIRRDALPPADAPKARFDPADAALHPDRALLDAPGEAALSRALPLLAWWLASGEAADEAAADAPPSTPAAQSTVPSGGPVPGPAARQRAWDLLPPAVRGERRRAWAAWRALDARERIALRAAARRFRAQPADAQAALRAAFDRQGFEARRGWWLGPRLGGDWPRLAALFGFVPPAERDVLLRLLREAGPGERDALARLAQATPPEGREALRQELLAQPPARRLAWLQARLQR